MFAQIFPLSAFVYRVTTEELATISPPYYMQEIEGDLHIGVDAEIEGLPLVFSANQS